MSQLDEDGFRLHEYEVSPLTRTITGPAGKQQLGVEQMSILLHMARHAGEVVEPGTLSRLVDRSDGGNTASVGSSIDDLRAKFGDHADNPRFIQTVGDRGFRLIAPVYPLNDVVLETESGPIHVQAMDGNHKGDFLLETSSGPVVLHPLSANEPQTAMRGWFAEMRRRRVFRAIAAYAVVAWLLLQITDVLSGALPVPDWTLPLATAVLALGFPSVALLAWIYQWTPEGLVLDIDERRKIPVDRFQLTRYVDLVIIAVLLVVVAVLSFSRVIPDMPGDAEIMIAILPFENLGADESDEYLSSGISDDIRSRLYRVPQFLIASRSSSRSLFKLGLGVDEIGERLDVSHVLEGSVRRDEDRVRVNVQLVDVDSGFSRWIKTYNTQLENVLDVQNSISLSVASELEVLLSRDLREVLADDPTDDPDAYMFYLQARAYLDRPRTIENLGHARDLFERAIGVDAEFALGYAGLCQAKIGIYHVSRDASVFADGEGECQQALTLNPGLAEVHVALGELYVSAGRVESAETAFLSAIRIDPRAVDAYSGLGDVYSSLGRADDAEEQYRQAISRQPGNWVGYARLGRHFLRQGGYRAAIQNYERVIELSPDNASAYNNLGVTWYFLGNFEEAAESYRQSLEINPSRSAYSNTGTMLYYAGQYGEAANMFRTATELTPTDYRLWGNLADAARFSSGTKAESDDAYQRAIDLGMERLSVNRTDSDTLSNLAWYHANLGNATQALRYISRAEEGASEFAEQQYVIGLTYRLLGRNDDATKAISKALDLGFPQVILDATPELINPGD